jgi:hypothetical protein
VSDVFTVHCPTHRSTVLLGARAIEDLRHTDDGIDLHWRCHCGTHGVLHLGVSDEAAVAA